MDRELAELVVEWYLDAETRLATALEMVPLSDQTENAVLPRLASTIVEGGSLLDSTLRAHYLGKKPKDELDIRDYFATFERKLALSEIKTLLYKRPLQYVGPFKPWDSGYKELSWWEAYNALKHDRTGSREKSTLRNGVDCLCALHQVIAKLDTFFWPLTDRRLLSFGNWSSTVVSESIYSKDPRHTITIVVETELFATPVGQKTFPVDPADIRPFDFEYGQRLWSFLGRRN
jgi:hypothetical protein